MSCGIPYTICIIENTVLDSPNSDMRELRHSIYNLHNREYSLTWIVLIVTRVIRGILSAVSIIVNTLLLGQP